MKRRKIFCFAAAMSYLIVMPDCGAVSSFHAQSGVKQTVLIELYSSEGCSSCPPADAWMNRLQKRKDLWSAFVPVVFHVDYWDALGWKDPFDSHAFTQRQGRYIQAWRGSSLYTPCVVANGRPWEGWRGNQKLPVLDSTPGILSVRETAPQHYAVTFESSKAGEAGLEAHAVLLGFGMNSDVNRGENAGRHFKHDFIVLDHQGLKLLGSPAAASFELHPEKFSGHKLGLAVWVSSTESPSPIQAAGGFIPTDESVIKEPAIYKSS